MQYILINGGHDFVEENVNDYIREGYTPYGPPSVVVNSDGDIVVTQAMMRKEK